MNSLILRLFVLFITLFSTLAHADWVTPSERVQEGISLRAGPSSQSTYRGQLDVGERLEFLSAVPYWYQVRLTNGQPAFVSKSWATIIPDDTVAATSTSHFTLDVIDVGTGLSVFIQGQDFSLLYDGGSNDDKQRGINNRLMAYLRAAYPSLTRIDHIILSHPHQDHVELLPDVMNHYDIEDIWDAGVINDICGYRAFIDTVVAKSATYHTARHNHGEHTLHFPKDSGNCYGTSRVARDITVDHGSQINEEIIELGNQARMRFLHASGRNHSSYNKNSLVIRLDLGTHRILLMGDAEAGSRNTWPDNTPKNNSIEGMLLSCCMTQLRSDVLVVGHHGSLTSSRRTFLDAVQATTYVIGAGPKKYHGITLPDQVVVNELESRGTVWRTDRNDAACANDNTKIGIDADNKPGGCDNIRIQFNNTISSRYLDLVD